MSAHEHTSIFARTDEDIRNILANADVSPDDIKTLCELRDEAKVHGLTVMKLASKLRVSTGTIYLVYNGNYPAGIGNFCSRARRWIANQRKESVYQGHRQFVQTGLARDLMVTFERVRYSRRIQPIESAEQMGKSTAARQYVMQNDDGAVMVTLKPEGMYSGFAIFLRDLAAALGYDPQNQKVSDIRCAVDERLDSVQVVIVDEAHMLHDWNKKTVRQFLDFMRINIHADGKRGICLIFTTPDNATRDTSVMDLLRTMRVQAHYNLGQLFGRMSSRVLSLESSDIEQADVRALVERYYKPGRECLQKLHRAAIQDGLGHLGLVDSVLLDASADATVSGKPLTDELVISVLETKLADIQEREAVA